MQFLKTLFWVAVAVLIFYGSLRNWHDVTINLWGDLQADIKVPVLVALALLIGFLPPFLLYRGRMWTLRRRLDSLERQRIAAESSTQQPDAEIA